MAQQDEKNLLGQILQNNKILFELDLTIEHFTTQDTKKAFLSITKIIQNGGKADLVTMLDEGPILDIATWTNYPTGNSKLLFSRMDKDLLENRLRSLSASIQSNLNMLPPSEILKDIELQLEKFYSQTKTSRNIKEILPEVIQEIEDSYNNRGVLPGIKTGLNGLDDILLGFQKRLLYYIGARPSQGKTALMLNFVYSAAIEQNKKVGILSMESSGNELTSRMISMGSKINSVNIKTGYIKTNDFQKITEIGSKLYDSNIIIDDETNLNVEKIRHKIKKMIIVDKIEILFVDYLQLVEGQGKYRRDEIREISVEMKNLARKYNIPIVCLAQLNRDSDNGRPKLSHFAESSQIEKDADAAIMIHNTDQGCFLLVEKNRDGRTGDLPVNFIKEFVRFVSRNENI